jgi:hypothetical protein
MATRKGKKRPVKRVRDARTGRFVPKREAKKRPSTTVTETFKR